MAATANAKLTVEVADPQAALDVLERAVALEARPSTWKAEEYAATKAHALLLLDALRARTEAGGPWELTLSDWDLLRGEAVRAALQETPRPWPVTGPAMDLYKAISDAILACPEFASLLEAQVAERIAACMVETRRLQLDQAERALAQARNARIALSHGGERRP